MQHSLSMYVKFQGKLNRLQFLGAFIFYIFITLMIAGAGFIAYEVIESNFIICPETTVDLRLEPNGPIVGTLVTRDCHQNSLSQEPTSLVEKTIGFCLSLLLSFAYMYPLFCLSAKRFKDIGFHPMIPFALIMTAEIADQVLFTLINAKSGLSMITAIMIIALCLFLPTKFNLKPVLPNKLVT